MNGDNNNESVILIGYGRQLEFGSYKKMTQSADSISISHIELFLSVYEQICT